MHALPTPRFRHAVSTMRCVGLQGGTVIRVYAKRLERDLKRWLENGWVADVRLSRDPSRLSGKASGGRRNGFHRRSSRPEERGTASPCFELRRGGIVQAWVFRLEKRCGFA